MTRTRIILLALAAITVQQKYAVANPVTLLDSRTCQSGEIAVDNSPFVIDLFCEDALGKYIGVAYKKPMGAPASSGWSVEDRYWQVKDWASDVQSLLLINKNQELLISTSGIYGNPGIYRLKLKEKTWKKIYSPKGSGDHTIFIREIIEASHKILFVDQSGDQQKKLEVTIEN